MSAPQRRFDLDAGASRLVENVHPADPFVDAIYPVELGDAHATSPKSPDKPLPATPSLSTPDPSDPSSKGAKKQSLLFRLFECLPPVRRIRSRMAERAARKRAAKAQHEAEMLALKKDRADLTAKNLKKHKNQFNGVSWGFDPNAGMTTRPNSGAENDSGIAGGIAAGDGKGERRVSGGRVDSPAPWAPHAATYEPVPTFPGQHFEMSPFVNHNTMEVPDFVRQRQRGMTWGLSEGGPGGSGDQGRN